MCMYVYMNVVAYVWMFMCVTKMHSCPKMSQKHTNQNYILTNKSAQDLSLNSFIMSYKHRMVKVRQRNGQREREIFVKRLELFQKKNMLNSNC